MKWSLAGTHGKRSVARIQINSPIGRAFKKPQTGGFGMVCSPDSPLSPTCADCGGNTLSNRFQSPTLQSAFSGGFTKWS